MSITSARQEIRAARRVQGPAGGPWRVKSTAGDYRHELRLTATGEVVCDTCMSRHGRSNCWARQRVVDLIEARA